MKILRQFGDPNVLSNGVNQRTYNVLDRGKKKKDKQQSIKHYTVILNKIV